MTGIDKSEDKLRSFRAKNHLILPSRFQQVCRTLKLAATQTNKSTHTYKTPTYTDTHTDAPTLSHSLRSYYYFHFLYICTLIIHTDSHRDRYTDTQTDRHTVSQTHRYTYTYTQTHTYMKIQPHRHIDATVTLISLSHTHTLVLNRTLRVYVLPTTYYLLPTTYYLLRTTYYILPTTYYL